MTLLTEIKRRIQTHREVAAGQGPRGFIPCDCLQNILTTDEVALVLADPEFQIPRHKIQGTADLLVREGLKVFAILLELNLESKLVAFIEHEMLDEKLPVHLNDLEDVIPEAAETFEALQWNHLAYRFRRGQYHRRIKPKEILPYIEESRIGGGGFSTVYKVLVHPAHQNLIPNIADKGVFLVRKEIFVALPNTTKDQNEEAELLFLLGSLKHENIVELLASYVKDGLSNLLFAPAELDLHDFLLLPNRYQGFEEDISILKALHGLSSAVAYLHNFRSRPHISTDTPGISMIGYHHDIKPRNVLVRGLKFILADFGLSKLKDQGENTKTLWKDSTFEYGAPECRDSETFNPGIVGRSLDIWSLGCVSSEVLVYMETGPEGVLNFRAQRLIMHTYGKVRCFHDGIRLSSKVIDYLNDFEKQSKSFITPYLLSIIRKMFAERTNDRPPAEEIEKIVAWLVVGALSHQLTNFIDHHIENVVCTVGISQFRTRLGLEKNRLLAWERVLGVVPKSEIAEEYERYYRPLLPQFCQVLEIAIGELKVDNWFDSVQDNHDFILATLQNTNNALCGSLSDDVKTAIDDIFSTLSTVTVDIPSLQEIESATTDGTSQYQDVGAIAAMKYMSLLLSQDASKNGAYPSIDAAMIRRDAIADDLKVRPQTYHYSYGYLPGEERKVLVERKGYGTRWKKNPTNEEFQKIGNEMFQRIQGLVAMLKHSPKPSDFRVLDCLGAFHDAQCHEFGIVYEFPLQEAAPVRLHKLLRQKKSQEINPDPSQKLALAKALVSSVHKLHIAGWIHKNISSHNILFFPEASQDWASLDLSNPYIIGFQHSRKDDVGAYTEGPDQMDPQREYQHPNYREGSRVFQRCYDYYSLGLVLLEIGLWISLSQIYERYPTYSPGMLRDFYIKCSEHELKIYMGPTYQSVTKKCLQFDEFLDPNDANFSSNFQKEILDQLRACRF